MSQLLNKELWIEENFGECRFGDKRLNKRLLKIVNKMSEHPENSIPQQMGNWGDIKACYKFLRNKKVTHKRIQGQHRERIKNQNIGKVTIYLQDTSELDFTNLEESNGLGFIGNHNNKGLMFHSCLAIEPDDNNPKVHGLANQLIWTRKNVSLTKNETRSQRNKRARESDIWLKNLKTIGSPPEGSLWVSVGDRANDIYEFFIESKALGWECLVRASQDRNIEVNGHETSLKSHVRSLKSKGTKEIKIRKENETRSRNILLNITWEKIELRAPQRLKKKGQTDKLTFSVVRCWNDEENLEWILYSSIAVETLEDAIEKIEWYAHRWIMEEYHKCLKTGCRIQLSQLETRKSLEALLGILGIVATLMLQLRNTAREEGERPAKQFVEKAALNIICKRFNLSPKISIRQFWHSVAKLGGFIGRKSDGEPGWQTLWKGWVRLTDMMWGLECYG